MAVLHYDHPSSIRAMDAALPYRKFWLLGYIYLCMASRGIGPKRPGSLLTPSTPWLLTLDRFAACHSARARLGQNHTCFCGNVSTFMSEQPKPCHNLFLTQLVDSRCPAGVPVWACTSPQHLDIRLAHHCSSALFRAGGTCPIFGACSRRCATLTPATTASAATSRRPGPTLASSVWCDLPPAEPDSGSAPVNPAAVQNVAPSCTKMSQQFSSNPHHLLPVAAQCLILHQPASFWWRGSCPDMPIFGLYWVQT